MLLVMLPLLSGNGKIVQALEVHGRPMHKAFANRAKLWYHCGTIAGPLQIYCFSRHSF
ncbi:hypothetical protein CISIN_1g035397mg [Citrus sinensis]|uniref:Uncharacterized protein n=1 Tax=Citrus sinensis TaxID=2711 RepID=A0A067EU23_CITSI|nr:hypothetical protein CISIN_1g035397mg [Citrus sinensis]